MPEAAIFYPRENFWDPIKPTDISWNFEKFILDRRGKPLLRFLPKVEPDDITHLLEEIGTAQLNIDRDDLIRKLKEKYLNALDIKYKSSS